MNEYLSSDPTNRRKEEGSAKDEEIVETVFTTMRCAEEWDEKEVLKEDSSHNA